MSARIYPDVCVLLTLDFEQNALFRKCTLFRESIQRANISCYLLSSVNRIHNSIIEEIVEAGGNSIRGLWHHLSMAKGGGVPYVLENTVLTEDDLFGIRQFFREKILQQKRELAKDQIQIQEVWAIDTFRKMEKEYDGKIPLFNYLKRLSTYQIEYYVSSKNATLRTKVQLNLFDEEPVDPNSVKNINLEKALIEFGFKDYEDINHIYCLAWLKEKRGYKPIFATTDRRLCECKDIILEHTGVIVEDALYAVSTYQDIMKKK